MSIEVRWRKKGWKKEEDELKKEVETLKQQLSEAKLKLDLTKQQKTVICVVCFKKVMVNSNTADNIGALCPDHQNEVKKLVKKIEELEQHGNEELKKELEQVKLTSQVNNKKLESVKTKLNEWAKLIGERELKPKGWWWW